MLATTGRAEMSALARIANSLGTSQDVAEVPLPDKVRCSKITLYSITSSARHKIDSGIVSPIAFAVFRFTISSN